MIIYLVYFSKRPGRYGEIEKCKFEGWFLFGIIPLYCRQVELPKKYN